MKKIYKRTKKEMKIIKDFLEEIFYSVGRRRKMLNKQQAYWINPHDKPNKPEAYVKKELEVRSNFLFNLMRKYIFIHRKNAILEIGCNAGRNLNYLYQHGFVKLSGIEINPSAIDLMKKVYPDMYKNSNITLGSLESTIPLIKDNAYNVTISMAVLMHLPYDSNFIFKQIARITKDYIITIENERPEILCKTHFPRDYQKIFGELGFFEIDSGKCKVKDLETYTWRIFKKK